MRAQCSAGATAAAGVAAAAVTVLICALAPCSNELHALDASGHPLWPRIAFPTNITRMFAPPGQPRALLYVTDARPYVSAVDLRSGQVVWAYKTGSPVHSIPVHGAGSRLFVTTSDGRLYGLDCEDGAQLVVDRVVYLCPSLDQVRPTQRDLCEELDNRCPDPE